MHKNLEKDIWKEQLRQKNSIIQSHKAWDYIQEPEFENFKIR